MEPSSTSRRPAREIVIKIVEGQSLEQRDTPDGPVLYSTGGSKFTALQAFETPDRVLLQSFPRFVTRLRGISPDAVGPNRWISDSLDLFLRLVLFDPADEPKPLVTALNAVSEVEYARPIIPVSEQPPSTVGDLEVNEGFLEDALHQGIDAHYAWGVATAAGATTDGRGTGLRVAICDQAYCDAHPNLPPVTFFGTMPNVATSVMEHGTKVLGVLGSPKTGGLGTIGICPGASFIFSALEADKSVDVSTALDAVLGAPLLQAGDVLLLEAQLSCFLEGWSRGVGPDLVPVEANAPTLSALAHAASVLGITVVEAAGDGGLELTPVMALGSVLWDPGVSDSLAILVGSGNSTDHSRLGNNFGARVDCQGWGENVYAPVCPDQYDANFHDTSSAAAIIAGLVTCLQGAYNGANGVFLTPVALRALLRNEALGSPQTGDLTKHIGPLPDLSKILCSLGICSNIHLRSQPEKPHVFRHPPWPDPSDPFLAAMSPDLLLRPDPLWDPDRAFGANTWSREFDSSPVSATANYTYVRMTNAGTGPDSAKVLAWWSHPSPFLHPRWWHRCSNEGATTRLLASGEIGVACVPWSASPRPGFASLIAAIISDRAPGPIPGAGMSTSEYLSFVKQHDHVGFRSVFAPVWSGAPIGFPCYLRGVPEGTAAFVLRLDGELPPGAAVTLMTARMEVFPGATSREVYVGNASNASLDMVLDANDEVLATFVVRLASSTPAGRYAIAVDQWMGDVTLGRVTFVVEVPSAPA